MRAADVEQGALGDCWFLSSLSVLATRPSLVKRLIVSDTNAKKYGIYTVKFSKAGVWRCATQTARARRARGVRRARSLHRRRAPPSHARTFARGARSGT